MRTRYQFVSVVAVSMLLAGVVQAQESEPLMNAEFGVSFTTPDGWDVVEGNERAIFNVKHDESQSQLEVIATHLMSADVANVFYETFHETLTQSNFEVASAAEEVIGAHTGTLTQYQFDYAGVTLRVVIFQFLNEDTAYLIVGYIKDDEFESHFASFREAVASITFTGE